MPAVTFRNFFHGELSKLESATCEQPNLQSRYFHYVAKIEATPSSVLLTPEGGNSRGPYLRVAVDSDGKMNT
jgi:hypothetical protein